MEQLLADLVARSLTGVRLVTSDAHQGLVEAIAANLPGASWQRCRTHYAANVLQQQDQPTPPQPRRRPERERSIASNRLSPAIVRSAHPRLRRTQAARRQGTKEILRCLKRAIAREVFQLITQPVPAVDHRGLRPLRQEHGLTQTQAAAALGVSPAQISLTENGHVYDAALITT